MPTTLAEVRADVASTLGSLNDVNLYANPGRRDYQYPCIVVRPTTMDVRPAMGDQRTYQLDVVVGHAVIDGEDAYAKVEETVERAVELLLEDSRFDVLPDGEFNEQPSADERVIVWFRIPLTVMV